MANLEKRIDSKGKETWRVSIRKKGFTPIYKSFRTEEEARIFADITERSYEEKGAIPRLALNVLLDRYEEEIFPTKQKAFALHYRRQFAYWREHLGKEIAVDLTSVEIERAADLLLSTISRHGTNLSPASRLRYIAALSSVFSTAIRKWKWALYNPCSAVDTKKELIREHRGITLGKKEEVDPEIIEFKSAWLYKIHEIMKKENLSESALAKKCKLPKTTIQNCLTPSHCIGLTNFLRICKELELKYGFMG